MVDPEEALKPGAPLLYPELGTNVVWHDTLTYGDVDGAMARAHGVLRERFTIQRYASTPLETFGAMVAYDAGTDSFEFWTNDQRPGLTISILAAVARRSPVAHPPLLPRHRRRLRQQAPARPISSSARCWRGWRAAR